MSRERATVAARALEPIWAGAILLPPRGNAWMKTVAMSSKEWKTSLLPVTGIAHASGPLAMQKNISQPCRCSASRSAAKAALMESAGTKVAKN